MLGLHLTMIRRCEALCMCVMFVNHIPSGRNLPETCPVGRGKISEYGLILKRGQNCSFLRFLTFTLIFFFPPTLLAIYHNHNPVVQRAGGLYGLFVIVIVILPLHSGFNERSGFRKFTLSIQDKLPCSLVLNS